ncbi:MAG TPA: MASE3 domain-containing protein [Patescibacteria group bacterium]|nr:MASE3 domain-containing protein [Patescibacteria group bacterium]
MVGYRYSFWLMSIRNNYLSIVTGVGVLVGLYLISLRNYLLFHGIAEIFSIVIAVCIFVLAWNTRGLMENSYLLFLGIAYLFVGMIDLLHTLAYIGMNVFPGGTTNLPTQLWITGRYLESMSLLVAPLLLGRRPRVRMLFAGYAVLSLVFLVLIFHWKVFPTCFVEGVGLTPFKKISEYVISLFLLGSIVALSRKREHFDPGVLRLLVASVVVTIASELSFTLYAHAYGIFNLIGHYLKIVSFYLIYKAIIETGLRHPYNLLFRELKQQERELLKYRDHLEELVRERTAELAAANEQLRLEIDERKTAKAARRKIEEALRKSRQEYQELARKLLAAQEDTRRRLARELHDDFSQRLAVLAMHAAKLERQNDNPPAVAEGLNRIQQESVKLSSDIHDIARQLHPSILDDLGLADAVGSACDNFSKHEGLPVDFRQENIPSRIPKDIALSIYRIVQEGLANIIKHARASGVLVSLSYREGALHLNIKDDGVGFDAAAAGRKGGLGLASMRERVHLIEGTLNIRTAPGEGTTIEASVPLPAGPAGG